MAETESSIAKRIVEAAANVRQQEVVPLKPETRAEFIERKKHAFAAVRERMNRSRLEVKNGDPTKSYYWGTIYPRELGDLRALGFTICKNPNLTCSEPHREDGSYQVGDAILLEIDKDEYEAMLAINELKNQEDLDGAIDKLIQEMSESQVETFEVRR